MLSVLFGKERAKPFARDIKIQRQEQVHTYPGRCRFKLTQQTGDHRRSQEGEVKNASWALSRLNYTKHKLFHFIFLGVTPMHCWWLEFVINTFKATQAYKGSHKEIKAPPPPCPFWHRAQGSWTPSQGQWDNTMLFSSLLTYFIPRSQGLPLPGDHVVSLY